jgi:hypothetical protein
MRSLVLFLLIGGISGFLTKSRAIAPLNKGCGPNSRMKSIGTADLEMLLPSSRDNASSSTKASPVYNDKKFVSMLTASATVLDVNTFGVFNKLFLGGFLAGGLHAITGSLNPIYIRVSVHTN